jgi:hypothetical protein
MMANLSHLGHLGKIKPRGWPFATPRKIRACPTCTTLTTYFLTCARRIRLSFSVEHRLPLANNLKIGGRSGTGWTGLANTMRSTWPTSSIFFEEVVKVGRFRFLRLRSLPSPHRVSVLTTMGPATAYLLMCANFFLSQMV